MENSLYGWLLSATVTWWEMNKARVENRLVVVKEVYSRTFGATLDLVGILLIDEILKHMEVYQDIVQIVFL